MRRARGVSRGSAVSEAVLAAGLRAMGELIQDEIGDGAAFALFVDWRDGKPMSYVSDVPRPRVVPILDEWLVKTAILPGRSGGQLRGAPGLEAKCAELGKSMVKEDVDVVLFLIAWGDDGEVAWFSSAERGRAVVEEWVKAERSRS